MEKAKKFFGTVWDWIKNHWQAVVVILVILAGVFLAVRAFSQVNSQVESYRNLLEQYHQESLDHQQQIKDLRSIMDEELQERDRLLQEYLAEQGRIATEFKERLGRIEQDRLSNQDDIIREHDRDPTTLTTAVTNTFGIPLE